MTSRAGRAIGHGLWILIPVLSFTLLSWLPATQAWWRSRKPIWLVIGLLLLVGTVTFVVSMGTSYDAFTGMLFLLLAIGGVIAAVFARQDFFGARPAAAPAPRPAAPARIATDPAVQAVLQLRELRSRAREIAANDLAMAYELAIGRPDLPATYDDGGLVDLNNVSADGLVSALTWDRAVAEVYVSARDLRGGYASWDELGALSGLEPSLVERDAERLILLPWRSR
ncbi:hypothetical protein [Jiangella anatolica]|uniref:Helix-hairpin-helix domain-containing protein n=1 Tax=Jiangella anatolica TaxID=2670374 RepID=A0A2W2BDD4_9ACTN|nr:hypothetical protein [Jiangella anatolica]PZF85115.1 hypothetical protein C1I92_05900 [Jiangella anatolica]